LAGSQYDVIMWECLHACLWEGLYIHNAPSISQTLMHLASLLMLGKYLKHIPNLVLEKKIWFHQKYFPEKKYFPRKNISREKIFSEKNISVKKYFVKKYFQRKDTRKKLFLTENFFSYLPTQFFHGKMRK